MANIVSKFNNCRRVCVAARASVVFHNGGKDVKAFSSFCFATATRVGGVGGSSALPVVTIARASLRRCRGAARNVASTDVPLRLSLTRRRAELAAGGFFARRNCEPGDPSSITPATGGSGGTAECPLQTLNSARPSSIPSHDRLRW